MSVVIRALAGTAGVVTVAIAIALTGGSPPQALADPGDNIGIAPGGAITTAGEIEINTQRCSVRFGGSFLTSARQETAQTNIGSFTSATVEGCTGSDITLLIGAANGWGLDLILPLPAFDDITVILRRVQASLTSGGTTCLYEGIIQGDWDPGGAFVLIGTLNLMSGPCACATRAVTDVILAEPDPAQTVTLS